MIAALLLQRMSAKRRVSEENQTGSGEKCEMNPSISFCCRTCLSTSHLVAIFNSSDEERMSHNLKLVTGLEIKRNDGLSQKICKKCLGMINLSLQFRRKSKKAEKALLDRVANNPNKGMTTTDDVKPKIKKAKVEHDDYDFDDIPFLDDFQNDDDYDTKPDVKPIYPAQEKPAQLSSRRQRQRPIRLPPGPPYKCNLCGKEFKMKATYSAHLRFHTNYCVCEACGKRCRNNNQLQEHKRAKHGLGRIHKCAYCEYSSATKEALVIHERRHTGERPYICDHCGAAFHRRANLVQHIAIHLPEKNFQCSFCPTREKSKKRLQIHISKAHREKRYSYKCPRCLKLFQRNEHAHRHLARVHHIPRPEHPLIEKVLIHNVDKDVAYKDNVAYRPAPYPQYEAAAEMYRQAMHTEQANVGLNLALM